MNLRALSNLELHEKTKYQAGVVRTETTKLLHHLVEVERRRVYAEFGTSSLFDYCVRHLEMSHPCASRHVNSARMMVELPEIEEKIQTGELTLTAVSQAQVFFKREAKLAQARRGTNEHLLSEMPLSVDEPIQKAKKFSTEEKREVLSQIANKSTREAEQVLLSLASEPAAVSIERVRAIADTTTEIKFGADKETMANLERLKEIWSHKMPGASFGELIKEMARVLVEQLDPLKKAERALARKEGQDKMRSPNAHTSVISESELDYETSAEVTLDSLQESEERSVRLEARCESLSVEIAYKTTSSLGPNPSADPKGTRDSEVDLNGVFAPEAGLHGMRTSITNKASAPSPAPDEAMRRQQQQQQQHQEQQQQRRHHRSRYISSAVRHAVYMRDGGACTHVDPLTGERCSSRNRIDLDHIVAFAKGGESTVENLRLRCRQHNLWYAIRVYGERKMKEASMR